MTSKTSCFDSAIFKRSLRKTLPLWVCYFLFWLFILPGDLISFKPGDNYATVLCADDNYSGMSNYWSYPGQSSDETRP